MKKAIIVEAISYIFTLGCFVFVMYQACSCLHKYLAEPKSTDVTIELASKHAYPTLTFCLVEDNDIFEEVLQTCNLTYDDYFKDNKWMGSCKDPAKLSDEVINDLLTKLIASLEIDTRNGRLSASRENFEYKHLLEYNCYSYKPPQNTEIRTIEATINHNASIFLGNEGDLYGVEPVETKPILVFLETSLVIDVSHEAIEVLDFDGVPCKDYGTKERDECVLETMHQKTMRDLGCTSPFGTNKSTICIDGGEKANEAKMMFKNISVGVEHHCPRSCKYLLTSFDTFTKYDAPGVPISWVRLTFPKFIKVSKSSWAYGMLELIAEVGGYVGLFLGVSVNQFTLLFKKIGKIHD